MMRLVVILILLTLSTFSAGAQSTNDTVKDQQIKEVQVRTERYSYERDVATNKLLYRKAYRIKDQKVKMNLNGGLNFDGIFSALAYKVNGQKKRAKRTVAAIANVQQQKFIDTRYTPELTARLTNLTGDSLGYFMNAYPMPFAYARAASELEMYIWIRENYRDWVAAGRPIPANVPTTIPQKQVISSK